jgi:hypothetical protein
MINMTGCITQTLLYVTRESDIRQLRYRWKGVSKHHNVNLILLKYILSSVLRGLPHLSLRNLLPSLFYDRNLN